MTREQRRRRRERRMLTLAAVAIIAILAVCLLCITAKASCEIEGVTTRQAVTGALALTCLLMRIVTRLDDPHRKEPSGATNTERPKARENDSLSCLL